MMVEHSPDCIKNTQETKETYDFLTMYCFSKIAIKMLVWIFNRPCQKMLLRPEVLSIIKKVVSKDFKKDNHLIVSYQIVIVSFSA